VGDRCFKVSLKYEIFSLPVDSPAAKRALAAYNALPGAQAQKEEKARDEERWRTVDPPPAYHTTHDLFRVSPFQESADTGPNSSTGSLRVCVTSGSPEAEDDVASSDIRSFPRLWLPCVGFSRKISAQNCRRSAFPGMQLFHRFGTSPAKMRA
jgi:hypothetical protein